MKKNKLTVNRLALGNLKARKKQYAIMIIGIILAMIFSSSAIFFASCIKSSNEEIKNIKIGKQDYIITNLDDKEMEDLVSNNLISSYDKYTTIGYGYTDNEDNGVCVSSMDSKAQDTLYMFYVDGAYPQNEGEIAIEQSALAMMKYADAKVGDTIKLTLKIQNGGSYLSNPVEKSYKLVGIIKDKRATELRTYSFEYARDLMERFPCAFVSESERVELGGRARNDYLAFASDSDNLGKSEMDISDYFSNNLAQNQRFESTMYYSRNEFTMMSPELIVLISIIFAAAFFIASAFAIINSFSSNLNERKKQIGMMKTVGATKRQIINIFGREAFIIALITLPISLIISYFGVRLISSFISGVFIFAPQPWVFVLCAAVCLVSVMVASLIPLVKASRISPVQAIRNVEYAYKLKKRKISSQKNFAPSKLIAKRSLVFNRSKQALVSIFMIIVIVGSCYGCGFIKTVASDKFADAYDYRINCYNDFYDIIPYNFRQSTGYNEADKNDILLNPYVDKVYGNKEAVALINKKELTDFDKVICLGENYSVFENLPDGEDFGVLTPENANSKLCGEYNTTYLQLKQKYNIQNEIMPVKYTAHDIASFDKLEPYVTDGKINRDKLLSGEEVILLAPKKASFLISNVGDGWCYGIRTIEEIEKNETVLISGESGYKAGDTINLSVVMSNVTANELEDDTKLPKDLKKYDKTVKIGAIVENIGDVWETFYTAGGGGDYFRILTTTQAFNSMCPDVKYSVFNITANTELDAEKDDDIYNLITQVNDRAHGEYVMSTFKTVQRDKLEDTVFFIVGAVLVILFVSICASIINNSLSAQIRASKRQIGTLRAVGASLSEIMKSYIHQLVSMLLTGSAIGFVLYFATYFASFMYNKLKYNMSDLGLEISVLPAIGACLVLFAVCSFNLWLKIKKETKNSIIDNIREL